MKSSRGIARMPVLANVHPIGRLTDSQPILTYNDYLFREFQKYIFQFILPQKICLCYTRFVIRRPKLFVV